VKAAGGGGEGDCAETVTPCACVHSLSTAALPNNHHKRPSLLYLVELPCSHYLGTRQPNPALAARGAWWAARQQCHPGCLHVGADAAPSRARAMVLRDRVWYCGVGATKRKG